MKQRVSFIFLFSTPTLTGQSAQPFALACELHRRGHPVLVATDTRRKGDFEGFIDAAGIPRLSGLALCTKSGPHEAIADTVKLKGIIAAEKPDVVVTSYSHDNTLAAIARSAGRRPRVVRFFHGAEPRQDPLSKLVLGRTDAFYFFSRQYRDNFAAALPSLAPRLHCLPGPVDVGAFQPGTGGTIFREAFGLTGKHLVLGMVARFQEGRGQETVIRAFAEVTRRHPHARLMLVGKGETQKEMEGIVSALRLTDRVVFAGFRTTDLTDAYRAMDVFIQLAEGHDTSCRAVIEAMATGLPVVCAARGAMAELYRDGVEGRFVKDPDDHAALAAALEDLAADPAQRSAMGEAARRTVVSSHSLPGVTDLLLETLK